MPDSYDMYKSDLRRLISSFAGQGNILTIPRPFIDFLGSLEAALLFNQMIYWSDRSTLPDKWFWKTYEDWAVETGLSEYQVRKIVRKMISYSQPLIATQVRKAQGNPTVHYQVQWHNFSETFLHFLRERTFRNSGNEPLETSVTLPIQRLLTEITPENTDICTAQNSAKAIWPDWYVTLWAIPGFNMPLEQARDWLDRQTFSGDQKTHAETTAYALKSKWPGDPKRPYRDPWATFQNWFKRPLLKEGGGTGDRNGQGNAEGLSALAKYGSRTPPA